MKIKTIEIRNYKSIKEMRLDLKDVNILIGANGSGKSNFISFFRFLNHILEDNLRYYVESEGGPDNILYFGRKSSSHIYLKIDFDNNEYYSSKLVPAGDFLSVKESNSSINSDNIAYENVGIKGKNVFDSMGDREFSTGNMKKAFASSKIYHFHDTGSTAKVKGNCYIDDNRFLRSDASNLSAFLYYLQVKHKKIFTRIEDTIRLVAPFFARFNLAPRKLKEDEIRLEWRHANNDYYFNANNFSDGTLRLICLITLLLQPELPDIILIDEPELGLHPYAITILTELLKSAGEKSQIIVSTQSVSFIDHFEPEDIIVANFEDNQSNFKRLDSKELAVWLEDYTLGEIWEKNVVGGNP